MSIKEQLRSQLTAAMKAQDRRRADVIRMIDTKVMERRTAKGFSGEVDDALYLDVIGAYRKSMAKAIDQYKAAGERGAEQVEQLQYEVDFCDEFLPKRLSEDEVREAVKAAIAETGADSPKMMGKIIGAVMKNHKGTVDAGDVKRIAAELLAG